MCGIAGEIRFDGAAVDVEALARMNQQQRPRGPDGQGLQVSDRFGFGHRRLKIMDLSDAAQQPMFDPTMGAGIVFNGAVYNHADLRKELEAKGYHFHSTGDTAVLLTACLHLPSGSVTVVACCSGATAWASSRCTSHPSRAACVSLPRCPRCLRPVVSTPRSIR